MKPDTNSAIVTVKPEWMHIKFEYFEADSKTLHTTVPQYIMLEGYNEDISLVDPVVRSNLYKNGILYVPWIVRANRMKDESGNPIRNKEKIVLKFKTMNTYVKGGKIEILEKSCGKDPANR